MTERTTTPTGVLLGREVPNTQAWHALRSGGIGASEVAAVLGISPWQSPYSLWHAKANGWTTEPSKEMLWGTAMETTIRAQWGVDNGAMVVTTGTWRHRSRSWQRCNPDGLIVDVVTDDDDDRAPRGHLIAVAGLELKVCNDSTAEWGTPGTDEIPPYYRTQVAWCMDTLGLDVWHVAVSRFGRYPDYYVVKYDPDEARLLRGHCAAFWRSLRHGQPPDLDGHEATYQAVRRLHPDIDGSTVTIPTMVALDWWAKRRMLAQAEEADREATAGLLVRMGSARKAVMSYDGTEVARRQPGARGSVALYNLAPKELRS